MNYFRGLKSAAPRRRIDYVGSNSCNDQFTDSCTPHSCRARASSRKLDQSIFSLLENMRLDPSSVNSRATNIGTTRSSCKRSHFEAPDSNEACQKFNVQSNARDGSLDSLERALEKTQIGATRSFVSYRNDRKRSRIGKPYKNRSHNAEDDLEVDRLTGQSHPPRSIHRRMSEPSPVFTKPFPCMFCKEAFSLRQSLHRHCRRYHLRAYTRKLRRPA